MVLPAEVRGHEAAGVFEDETVTGLEDGVLTIGGPLCFHCLTDPDTDPSRVDREGGTDDVPAAVTQVLGTAVCAVHAIRERHLIRLQLRHQKDALVAHLAAVEKSSFVADGGALEDVVD